MPPKQGNLTKVFGQATKADGGGGAKKGGAFAKSSYQRQMGQSNKYTGALTEKEEADRQEWLERKKQGILEKQKMGETLDAKMGYARFETKGEERTGWLFNMLPTTVPTETGVEKSGLDLYFLQDDSSTFKATVFYEPYFYIAVGNELLTADVMGFLKRKFESSSLSISTVKKEDLELPNHLSGLQRTYLKLSFQNVSDLMEVRQELSPAILKKQDKEGVQTATVDLVGLSSSAAGPSLPSGAAAAQAANLLDELVDIREYDVPYLVRCSIDLDIRCGNYYGVTPTGSGADRNVSLTKLDTKAKPSPRVLAFDIECTKAPLKFPNASHDEIFMISYMVDGQGFLIISREIVSEDVQDFEYTPKPTFPGPFKIFNEKNEADLIRRFFDHIEQLRPQVIVTYNGDFFDWPFLEKRSTLIGISMFEKIGVELVGEEYRGRCCVHLDAFAWVKRDSYLPQGAQGLKAVTKYKLDYDPVEVDPEDMVRLASEDPAHMASYSVSDAVATYYLYDQYVHLFIFSLCTLIPMGPEDVLRKGSGTLCEMLLMVEAYRGNIVCPNKHVDPLQKFHNGHLLEAETYIGGHVECLETGVYRSDIPCKFNLVPSALQGLINNIDRDLTFFIEVEGGMERSTITNYDEVKTAIVEALELLRDCPVRDEEPYIYHLDVGAMYPNIILTNRLQPGAVVSEATCAACVFNQEENDCKRKMDWIWRGDYTPAKKNEYQQVKAQLQYESVDGKPFHEYDDREKAEIVKKRLNLYSHKVYKRTKDTKEETRTDTVCMRENPFYVETVRNFRDRRYDYKLETKKWKGELKKAEARKDAVAIKHAEDMCLVYDSLQVAHKCILNSFYGYVMRKGARWRSMEMAGIVTLTGANLITQARELVEQIGRPLELDTDGIWCILPKSFPDNFTFKTKDGGKLGIQYPCCMLNSDVHDRYTNHQYQTLVDPHTKRYTSRSECSIFFEVDGPYKAMILPASTEEGKLLKKRYAVFDFDGSLAELKGFELKRRGELELIKAFQQEVFEHFLDGDSLESCYDAVANIANHWMDVLDSNGESLLDAELFDLISENKSISNTVEEYGDQKRTSLTTARRLGEFLGAEMIADKGLNCKFIISSMPYGAPVTERAIPTAIWRAEPAVMKTYLRRWLKDSSLENFDVRTILDWDYYRKRLANTVQKIITIPAALQGVKNPVPRVAHPDWLVKIVRSQDDKYKQKTISSMFTKLPQGQISGMNGEVIDIEDMTGDHARPSSAASGKGSGMIRPVVHKVGVLKALGSPPIKKAAKAGLETLGKTFRPILPLSTATRNPTVPEAAFASWLEHRKSKWLAARKEDKRSRTSALIGGSSAADAARKRKVGVEGFLREAAQSLTHGEWQILEIRETETPGEFVIFAMIDGASIQRIKLVVPRTFYVNCKTQDMKMLNSSSVKVVKDLFLPHSRTPLYTYQLTISERRFQQDSYRHLSDPQVEAAYETKTPLFFEALSKLGGVSRVMRHKREEAGKSGTFNLTDLEIVERPTTTYLDLNSARFKRIFMFHSCSGPAKGIVALFFTKNHAANEQNPQPDSVDLSSHCQMWVVKNAKNKQHEVSRKSCETLFANVLRLMKSSSDDVDPEVQDSFNTLSADSECTFELEFVGSEVTALSNANSALNNYIQEKNGPTLLITNTRKSVSSFKKIITATTYFPLLYLPFSVPTQLPSLTWEQPAVNMAVQSFLNMGAATYPRRLKAARYGNIPLGNFGADETCAMFDLFYARQLRKARSLLWASESPKPDLGAGDDAGSDFWIDEEVIPEVNVPGAYRTVCVELDINHLAIAALISLDLNVAVSAVGEAKKDKKRGDEAVAGDSELGDEMAVARPFKTLQTLVATWYKDAMSLNNVVANDLLKNCYRLICAPESLLHDPAIKRVLHGLMHKLFSMLVSEFQNLGAKVIFADYSRMIIATNKTDLVAAKEYVDFVIKTIGTRECVGEVRIEINKFWSDLLFLDANNYGGMEFKAISSEEDVEIDGKESFISNIDGQNYSPSIGGTWHISDYLASEVHGQYFLWVVAKFSMAPFEKRQKLSLRSSFGGKVATPFSPAASTPGVSRADGSSGEVTVDEELIVFKRTLVSKQIAAKVTMVVDGILKENTDVVWPNLPGSYLRPTNPALEFIKSVSKVLSLDPDVTNEANVVRKSALVQVGMHEYSEESKWVDPCYNFVLPNLFCQECKCCRNLNLCVTANTQERIDEEGNKVLFWECPDCHEPYDTSHIEWRLIEMIQKRATQFQVQDLRCSKTKQIVNRVLAKESDCSAPLMCDIDSNKFLADLRTLQKIAEHHHLEWLNESASALLLGRI